MKNSISFALVITVLMFAFSSKAQGNLQFNRAIDNNYSISVAGSSTGASGYNITTTTITVPAGKVWKIEACHVSTSGSSNPTAYSSPGATSSSIGLSVTLDLGVISNGSNGFNGPLWLAAGAHTLVLYGTAYNTSQTYTHNVLMSGIEFNITQ